MEEQLKSLVGASIVKLLETGQKQVKKTCFLKKLTSFHLLGQRSSQTNNGKTYLTCKYTLDVNMSFIKTLRFVFLAKVFLTCGQKQETVDI